MKELSDVDIRHFKLSSGDDVISMVIGEQEDVVIISQPMQVHSVVNNNTQAYYFTDWQPLAKVNGCAISKLHIISFVECNNNVKEKYVRMCLEDSSTDMGTFLDTDIDELDLELDEYLSDQFADDGNPTIH